MHRHGPGHVDWRSIPPSTIDLVRAAVLPAAAAAAAWRRWSADHDIDELPDGAFPLLSSISANLPDDVVGPDAERLRGIRRRTWTETELRLPEADEAVATLSRLGLEPLLTGSLARLADGAHPPGTVPLSSFELVVDPGSFTLAGEALAGLGWEPIGPEPPWTHVSRLARRDRRLWLYRWHRFPLWSEFPDDDVRARSTLVEWRGTAVRRRTVADEFTAIVAPRWDPSDGPRRIHDAVVLLRGASSTGAVWDQLATDVPDDLRYVVADALAVCRHDFDVSVPDELIERLAGSTPPPTEGRGPRGHFSRYRSVSSALGQRPSVPTYVAARWSTMRRVGVRRAVARRLRVERPD